MILKVFTVFDHAAKAYLQPFFLREREEAVRGFSEVVNDNNHMFGRYPDSYTLFEIGEWDDSCASFRENETPEPLGNGVKYKKIPVKSWAQEMLPENTKGESCAQ